MEFKLVPSSVRAHQAAACAHDCLSCFIAIDWFREIKSIDWYNEIRLLGTATLIASIVVAVISYVEKKNYLERINFSKWVPNWIWLRKLIVQSNIHALIPEPDPATLLQRRGPTCVHNKSHYDSTHRISLTDIDVCVYAWPSKGGVIILDHAEAVDLEFLGLDPLDPPDKRLPDQNDEDAFCQRLLLLGAKWWDSEARYSLLASFEDPDHEIELGDAPMLTMKERRWVSVAWPTTGGFWIIEHDTAIPGILEKKNLVPSDVARLRLARTMDERSQVLRDHFNAKFYAHLRDYKGFAFLNSWEEKETGEVGPLMPLLVMD